MEKSKSYTGIDAFRMIAALLIIAIHTSPLASFSETGDFILTRIIARTAVPFFFMTSGFFLISRYSRDTKRLKVFLEKTAVIYGAAVLFYLPVNLYNGYFQMEPLLPNIIRDLVFDGTLYHLWYLPASIMGAAIAWYLVKRQGWTGALITASLLYLAGLFGDSYYGITEKISGLKNLYELLFQIFDHTRNGIFFAPVFFVLGGFLAEGHAGISLRKSSFGLCVSLALMLGEGLILHHFRFQRHDSMYVFLPLCMYFLFSVILHLEGKRLVWARSVSLAVYIVHPMMIIVIRLAAKLFHLEYLLVENSIIHYLSVCLTSLIFGAVWAELWKRRGGRRHRTTDTGRAYIQADLDSLEHNIKVLEHAMPPECRLMAVVKAEAYGHGMYEMAVHMNRSGVRAFAVATIDEGIMLRRYGISGEILILGYTDPERAKELCRYDLMQTLIDYEYALLLNRQRHRVKVHIKIDTGMHRLGFDRAEPEKIARVFSMRCLRVCGIYTHLCVADSLEEKDVSFTHMQIERFYTLLDTLKDRGITLPAVHIQSSYGLLNYPELKCDYVRAGIALYGVLSRSYDQTKLQLDLRPVFSLRARVVLIRRIRKGESVGYGRAFTAARDSIIAILPVGYADGFPGSLSCGKSYVLIKGYKAPVAGRICMDQMAVDVTDIPGVRTGMTATLIGRDGEEEISAPEAAAGAESITNELLSRMGRRLKTVRA